MDPEESGDGLPERGLPPSGSAPAPLAQRPLSEPAGTRLRSDAPNRREILAAHAAALQSGDAGYPDPGTGLFVLTAAYLAARGSCCGRGCRHCPYVQEPPAPGRPGVRGRSADMSARAECDAAALSLRRRPRCHGGMGDDDLAETFNQHRQVLVGVAYRILGSVSDAEDVVQETWLRWSAADRSDVRDPRAFLTTSASRLALNALRARTNRRETYPGPWLPEPVLTDDRAADPAEPVLLAESVSLAFLVVLESLTPLERVVFVLHDLFGFEHAEVARAVDRAEPAVRQLASRARRHVRERRPRVVADPSEHARVTAAFMRAAVAGDVESLLAVLAPDVVVITDGGGLVKAARRPLHGADKVARFLAAISGDVPGVRWEITGLNGRNGVLVHAGDQLIAAVDLDTAEGRVSTVRVQLNPEKLAGARPA